MAVMMTVPGQRKSWLLWIVFPRSPGGEIEFKYKYSLGMSVWVCLFPDIIVSPELCYKLTQNN